MEESHRNLNQKTMKRPIVSAKLPTYQYTQLDIREIIPDFQFGLRPEHSSEQQALHVTEGIFENWNVSRTCCALFLDNEKRFDLVRYKRLMFKFRDLNYHSRIIKLIH